MRHKCNLKSGFRATNKDLSVTGGLKTEILAERRSPERIEMVFIPLKINLQIDKRILVRLSLVSSHPFMCCHPLTPFQ